jgi:hypothetical protein
MTGEMKSCLTILRIGVLINPIWLYARPGQPQAAHFFPHYPGKGVEQLNDQLISKSERTYRDRRNAARWID